MRVTIQEVAEAAGVSKATVSKVLHKSYSISQETCDRVNAVIKELGYQPNRRAQSFATGATKTILFLAELHHPHRSPAAVHRNSAKGQAL